MDEVNFNVVQGDTFTIRVEYRDESNQPIDLTGYSAVMVVRDKPGGKVICAELNEQSGIEIDGPNGFLDITIPPSKTRKFTTPKARYQIQVINDQGVKTTVLSGYFAVSTTVIR